LNKWLLLNRYSPLALDGKTPHFDQWLVAIGFRTMKVTQHSSQSQERGVCLANIFPAFSQPATADKFAHIWPL
jgi:hypothetical protein